MFEEKFHGCGKALPFASQNGQIEPLMSIEPPGGTPMKAIGWPGGALKLEHQGTFCTLSPGFPGCFSFSFSLAMRFLS